MLEMVLEGFIGMKDLVFSDEGAKTVMFLIALDVRAQVKKLASALTALEKSHGMRLTRVETHVGIPLVPKEGT